MSATARRVLVALLGLVPAVFTAASAAWWWDRLPASLPTHWSALGGPDGFSSRSTTVAVVVALTTAGSLVVVGACAWFRPPVAARAAAAAGGFVTGLTAGTWVSTAAPTLLAPSPAQATLGWWLLVLLASGGWALIAWLLRAPSPVLPEEEAAADQDAPVRPVAPGERVNWSTVIGPTWLTWVAASLLVVEAAVAVAVPATAPAAVVALALTLVFARLEVTVDRRGLRLVAGLVRVPVKRIPLDRIVRAEVEEDLRPGEWGGWGYRIAPGRSALVLRGGPALVVTTTDGRRFAATVRDPAVPAGLLNGLAAARQPR